MRKGGTGCSPMPLSSCHRGGGPDLGQLGPHGDGVGGCHPFILAVLRILGVSSWKVSGRSQDQGRWGLELVVGSGGHRVGPPGQTRVSGRDQEASGIN